MNELRIFNNVDFGEIRTVEQDGNIWFIGKDIAMALGYADTDKAIRNHVDEEDKLTHQNGGSGQARNMIVINESGLYSLVLSSKLPKAKAFKRWITSEVIPSIRKTGSYSKEKAQPNPLKALELEIRLNNSRARLASEYRKIAEATDLPEYKRICQQKAAEVLAGAPVLPMQESEKKTLSATEIGKLLGITAHKVGVLANKFALKSDAYGKYFYDKSPNSNKQVETFRYYENAVEKFKELLEGGAAK